MNTLKAMSLCAMILLTGCVTGRPAVTVNRDAAQAQGSAQATTEAIPELLVPALALSGPGGWVVPLEELGSLAPGQRLPVTFESGAQSEARVVLFERARHRPGAARSAAARWLDASQWNAVTSARSIADSLPAIVIQVPTGIETGRCWIGNARARVVVVDSQQHGSPRRELDAALTARLAPACSDPTQAWRAELVGSSAEHLLQEDDPSDVSARLNISLQLLWQSALDRLREIDPRVVEVVIESLAPVSEVTPRHVVPVWPNEGVGAPRWMTFQEARLLRVLLSDTASAPEVLRATNDYLAETPMAGVRIEGLTPDGDVLARVCNFSSTSITITPTSDTALELELAGPHGSTEVVVGQQDVEPGGVLVNKRIMTRTSAPLAFASTPPGTVIGPLRPPLSMSEWRRMSTQTAAPSRPVLRTPACLGRLYRDSIDTWVLYLEIESLRDETLRADGAMPRPEADPESILIWMRDRDGATITVSIAPHGGWWIRDQSGRPRPDISITPPVIQKDPNQLWRVWCTLPSDVLQRGEVIELALTHRLPGGDVAAWPLAMTPWHTTPAFARIDLTRWDGLDDQ